MVGRGLSPRRPATTLRQRLLKTLQVGLKIKPSLAVLGPCSPSAASPPAAASPAWAAAARPAPGKQALALKCGRAPTGAAIRQTRAARRLPAIQPSNVNDRDLGRWSAGRQPALRLASFKSTPLMDDGVLYPPRCARPQRHMTIEAATGKTIPFLLPKTCGVERPRPRTSGPRSLACWTDGTDEALLCHHSIRAADLPCESTPKTAARPRTGDSARKAPIRSSRVGIPLKVGELPDLGSVSPALVVGGTSSSCWSSPAAATRNAPQANPRGCDVRPGKLLWTFTPTSPAKASPAYDFGKKAPLDYVGNVRLMDDDPRPIRNRLCATSPPTPSNDFYGGQRKGDSLYAESIVCLDAKSGKKVWHFQTVHHGVWDYDNPSAPDHPRDPQERQKAEGRHPAHQAELCLRVRRCHRRADLPHRRAAVPIEVPGEDPRRRPFPVKPGLRWRETGYHEEDLIDFTPELAPKRKKMMEPYEEGRHLHARHRSRSRQARHADLSGLWRRRELEQRLRRSEVAHHVHPIRPPPQCGRPHQGRSRAHQQCLRPVRQPRRHGAEGPADVQAALGRARRRSTWTRANSSGACRSARASDFVKNNEALQGLNLDFSKMGRWDIKPASAARCRTSSSSASPAISRTARAARCSAPSTRPMARSCGRELPGYVTGAPMTYTVNGKQIIVVAVSTRGTPAEYIALAVGDGVDGPKSPTPRPCPPAHPSREQQP